MALLGSNHVVEHKLINYEFILLENKGTYKHICGNI
jgi:hypothetical protein